MNIKAMSQDNIWKNPISCNVTNKKITIYIIVVQFISGLERIPVID